MGATSSSPAPRGSSAGASRGSCRPGRRGRRDRPRSRRAAATCATWASGSSPDDLGSAPGSGRVMTGAAGVIHIAGSYRVGIPASERPAMYEANVGATQRVLDAAIATASRGSSTSRPSTSSATPSGGSSTRRTAATRRRLLSYYDETKYLAHVAAEARIEAGAPIVIVLPGTVYGPGDHSGIGEQLQGRLSTGRPLHRVRRHRHRADPRRRHRRRHRRGARSRPARRVVHPDRREHAARRSDARSRPLAGGTPPRLSIPNALLCASARACRRTAAARLGLPPNLREIVRPRTA